ncbi:co-chaperone GroES [Patescibacteria group bacterium]|nr:co-chaperone GroES [Patescibacteria group bacterium]MCL5114729.1 co-chaperone GroES [Patescibacteria group bacterium]
MNVKPLSNRVLVELIVDEQKTTKSGIVLPDTVDKKEQTKGIVVAVGPGKFQNGARVAPDLKPGDKVLFSKPWGDDKKIEEGEKTYFLVDEDDILAIIQ